MPHGDFPEIVRGLLLWLDKMLLSFLLAVDLYFFPLATLPVAYPVLLLSSSEYNCLFVCF